MRKYFFQTDEDGERGNPNEVHHACDKEKDHQCPATTGAKSSVFNTHCERATPTIAPASHDEFDGTATMGETTMFQRRELERASRQQENAAEHCTRAGHRS